MDCLMLPAVALSRRCTGSRLGHQRLVEDELERLVTVVVGKEKREFLVDACVLEENPFQVLMETVMQKEVKGELEAIKRYKRRSLEERAIYVDVDAILFEHLLWLMHNDCSSLFQLNLKEIIDFYAHEN